MAGMFASLVSTVKANLDEAAGLTPAATIHNSTAIAAIVPPQEVSSPKFQQVADRASSSPPPVEYQLKHDAETSSAIPHPQPPSSRSSQVRPLAPHVQSLPQWPVAPTATIRPTAGTAAASENTTGSSSTSLEAPNRLPSSNDDPAAVCATLSSSCGESDKVAAVSPVPLSSVAASVGPTHPAAAAAIEAPAPEAAMSPALPLASAPSTTPSSSSSGGSSSSTTTAASVPVIPVFSANILPAVAVPSPSTSASSTSTREKELYDEGLRLAKQLHEERERTKRALAKCENLEAQVESSGSAMTELNRRLRENEEARALLVAQERASSERLRVVEAQLAEYVTMNSRKDDVISDLKNQLRTLQSSLDSMKRDAEEESSQREAELREAAARQAIDVEVLRDELRRTVVDCERRTHRLEKELSAALARAHVAEGRNVELSLTVSSSSSEWQAQVDALRISLQSAASAHMAVSSELETNRKRLEDVMATHTQLKAERQSLLAEVAKLKAALAKDQQDKSLALDEARRAQAALAARNDELTKEAWRLSVALAQAEAQRGSAGGGDGFGSTVALPSLSASSGDSSSAAGASTPALFNGSAAASGGGGAFGGSSSAQLRDKARSAIWDEERKTLTSEVTKLRAALSQLSMQHDALLQMYGQLADELALTKPSTGK